MILALDTLEQVYSYWFSKSIIYVVLMKNIHLLSLLVFNMVESNEFEFY
tara:strand:+ start:2815 stop:2961 length:147 start_codon:yes stop_codon:yes gene_type:complete